VSRNNRHVVPRGDGWAVQREGAGRASGLYGTQREAEDAARRMTHNTGGGEVVTHRPDGRIRDSDTVSPGNDPFPPRDKV
jgi:hypothetical protein